MASLDRSNGYTQKLCLDDLPQLLMEIICLLQSVPGGLRRRMSTKKVCSTVFFAVHSGCSHANLNAFPAGCRFAEMVETECTRAEEEQFKATGVPSEMVPQPRAHGSDAQGKLCVMQHTAFCGSDGCHGLQGVGSIDVPMCPTLIRHPQLG